MDKRQFVRYVEEHQQSLRRMLIALCCGDSSEADDIAQDTFVKAYLSCEGFRDEDKFKAWIFRIAYNTFISYKRRQRPNDNFEQAQNMVSSFTADRSFEYQKLYLCLERLSEKERYAVLLFYMQGYNIREIATITESTYESVKTLLSRGRHHLKELMSK